MNQVESRVIQVRDLDLPADYDFRQAEVAGEYTCRVCDGDTYDETNATGLEYFRPL
jgi:hypothetical protein